MMPGPWEKYAKMPTTKTEGPWAKYRAPNPEAAAVGGAGQAALESYGNAATLGYLPHIQAAVEGALPSPTDALDDELRAQGFKIEQPGRGYIAARDANIARHAAQKREHPYAAGAGAVAGTIASVVGAGGLGAAAKGASAVQRLTAARNAGAVLGAASNPGDVAGKTDLFQVGDRVTNAVVGGVAGMGGQLLAEGVGAAATPATNWLREKAAKSAARSAGRPTPTVATKMAKNGEDIKMGRALLDEGAVPFFGTAARVQKRIETLRNRSWREVEKLLKSTGDKAVVNGDDAAMRILESEELATLREAGEVSSVKALEDAAEQLSKMGDLTLERAQKIKRTIDEKINFNRANPADEAAQEARFAKRTALRDQMDRALENEGGGKGSLKAALKRQGTFEKAAEIGEREAGRLQANEKFGLTDIIAGGAGAAYGDDWDDKAIMSALLVGLNKGRRSVGAATAARSYDALAKQLARVPRFSRMAEKNPAGFSAAVERFASRFSGGGALQPQYAQNDPQAPTSKTTSGKGPSAWARRGSERLGLSPTQSERLMQNPKAMQLLIEASELAPNSPAMQRIKERIQKGWPSQ